MKRLWFGSDLFLSMENMNIVRVSEALLSDFINQICSLLKPYSSSMNNSFVFF